MVEILLLIYLAGMPAFLAILLWAMRGAPDEDLSDLYSLQGIAAVAFVIALWPVFLALGLYDVWSDEI